MVQDKSTPINLYKAYNLSLSLPFKTDLLPIAINKEEPVSFYISDYVDLPENISLKSLTDGGKNWSISNIDNAYYNASNLGLFQISDGKTILFRPNTEISKEEILKALLFTPLALILYQRGNLVMHASACYIKNKSQSILIAGQSGLGKSTLLHELLGMGNKMLSEDVSTINLSNIPEILPSFPLIKLGPQNMKNAVLEEKIINIKQDERNRSLYRVNQESFMQDSDIVKSCYFLMGHGEQKIEYVSEDMEKLKLIYKNIWRQVPYNSSIESEKIILKNIGSFLNEVNCFKIWTSKNPSLSAEKLIDHIESYN